MQTRPLGNLQVSAIGLGAMHFSFAEPVDDERSIRAIHAAIDEGVTLIDTALCYTTARAPKDPRTGIRISHNELVVAKALLNHPQRDEVVVATKGGHHRESPHSFPKDGRPESIRAHCDMSLRALGVETLGLYQMHWPDPKVPIAESMGAFAELQSQGKIRLIGGSNFSISQIQEAQTVCDLVSVQNHFSPDVTDDRATLDYCQANGIAYLPYSPLGGSGKVKSFGKRHPSFQAVADARGVSVQQVVLAWHLAQSPVSIPIPGTRRPEGAVDCARAAELELSDEELASLL